jgi:hypothetical protein
MDIDDFLKQYGKKIQKETYDLSINKHYNVVVVNFTERSIVVSVYKDQTVGQIIDKIKEFSNV